MTISEGKPMGEIDWDLRSAGSFFYVTGWLKVLGFDFQTYSQMEYGYD